MRIVAYNFLRAGSLKRCGHWSRVISLLKPDLVLAQECRPPETFFPASCSDMSDAMPSHGNRQEQEGGEADCSHDPHRSHRLRLPITKAGSSAARSGIPRGRNVLCACSAFMDPLVSAGVLPTQCKTFSIALPGCVETPTWSSAVTSMSPLGIGNNTTVSDSPVVSANCSTALPMSSIWRVAGRRRIRNRPLAQTLRWMGNPSAPYHCDGIFVPRSWLPRLVCCRVIRGPRWNKLSDHNPVVAEFAVAGDRPKL